MFRTLFVLSAAVVGAAYALTGPFYALLFYLWLAYFRPESWVWGGVAATLPLSISAGVFLLGYSLISATRWLVNPRVILLFLVLAHGMVSVSLSREFVYAWPYWVDFAKAAIITYLIACLVTTPEKYRMALVVIVGSLGFEVVKQGWAQLLFNPGAKNFNPHPFLGDENGVAMGVLMMVPMVSALAATASRRWERRGYAFVLVGAAYRAISTYSRGAFLSAGALLAMTFVRSTHKLRTALAVAVLCLIILPVLPTEFWDRMGTIAFSEDRLAEEDNSSRGRLHFWRVAVSMANDHPFFGVGLNAFNPHYDMYDFSDGFYGTGRAVHSTWFGVLGELGYLGAMLFGLSIVLALMSAFQIRRAASRGELPKELGIYATALEGSLVVYCVGGTFLTAQYLEMFWHQIGLSIALTAIAAEARVNLATPAPARPSMVAAASSGSVSEAWIPPSATRATDLPVFAPSARGDVR